MEPTVFDTTFKKCEECRDGYFYSEETKNCAKCPKDKPIEKNGQCEECPKETYYDSKAMLCVMCGAGSSFNETLQACATVIEPKCPLFGSYNKDKQMCECPADRPYTDGVECMACDLPHYWSEQTNKCEECKEGLVYNSIVKKCQLCPNDRPVEKDGKCEACPSNSHYDPVSKLCLACA